MNNFRTAAPPSRPIQNLDFENPLLLNLAGGIRCYRLPQRDLGAIRLDIIWPYGTREQSHIYEARTALSLSLSGSAKLTAEQIHEEFEYHGTSVSSDTQLMQSAFQMKSAKDQFLESFGFFLDQFEQGVYPDSELANYIQIEQAGLLRKMQTPRYWSNRLCMQSLYDPSGPMGSFADPEDIAALNRTGIQDYKTHNLNLSDGVYILSGDVDDRTFDAFAQLLQHRSYQKSNPQMARTDKTLEHLPSTLRHHVEHTNQVSLYMAKRFEAVNQKDIHHFTLLNMILGGFFGSRLMQEIREERGLTYGIGSFISQTTDGNVWGISGEMNAANVPAAMEAIDEILKSLTLNPPAGDELERAKRYYSGQLRTSFDGPFSMAGKIRNLMVKGYDFDHYHSALDCIWSATTDNLMTLAHNYLQADTFNTVLAGDIKP